MRFDIFLKKAHLVKSRSKARDYIEDGAVLLNGRLVKASHEVRIGDRIETIYRQKRKIYVVDAIPEKNIKVDFVKEEVISESR